MVISNMTNHDNQEIMNQIGTQIVKMSVILLENRDISRPIRTDSITDSRIIIEIGITINKIIEELGIIT